MEPITQAELETVTGGSFKELLYSFLGNFLPTFGQGLGQVFANWIGTSLQQGGQQQNGWMTADQQRQQQEYYAQLQQQQYYGQQQRLPQWQQA